MFLYKTTTTTERTLQVSCYKNIVCTYMFTIKARLILVKEDKIVLLLQTTKQGGKYTLVGGRVEQYEYAREALVRECFEEIGIELLPTHLSLVHVLHKKKGTENTLTLYFTTTIWRGVLQNKEPKKFKGANWFPIHKLPPNTSPTTRHVIKKILAKEAYSEFNRINK